LKLARWVRTGRVTRNDLERKRSAGSKNRSRLHLQTFGIAKKTKHFYQCARNYRLVNAAEIALDLTISETSQNK
jgi:hypothetical protein